MVDAVHGTAFASINANGSTGGSPTNIPLFHGELIVNVTTSSANIDVRLPAGADIGDVVELYVDTSVSTTLPNARLYEPSTSETIGGFNGDLHEFGVKGVRYRKMTTSNWARLII